MKKRYFLIVITIMIITCVAFGASYAVWKFSEKQNDFNTLGSKCFELTLKDETEGIHLEKAYPISDETGLSLQGYTFTIKNTCNTYATYSVNLEDILTSSKRLSNEYIKVSLNNGTPNNLSQKEEMTPTIEKADASFKLTSGSLAPEEEETYTLKLWMDEETPAIEEVMNATFESKISVVAGYTEEEQLQNEIEVTSTSKNTEYSNELETFTITAISEKYNIIEYKIGNDAWTSITPTKTLNLEKEFTKEGSYKFTIKDEVGNQKEITIETTKLDQTAPEIETNVTDIWEGSKTITITLKDTKSGLSGYQITETEVEPTTWIEINGNTKEITYEATENKTYYIWTKDKAGNQTHKKVKVSKVDSTKPSTPILTNSSNGNWTNQDVTVTITSTDLESGIDHYEWLENGTWTTRALTTNNGVGTIRFTAERDLEIHFRAIDKAGNISEEGTTVVKLDKTSPHLSNITNSSNGNWTKSITLSWTLSDERSGIEKVEQSTDQTTWQALSSEEQNGFTRTNDRNDILYIRAIDKAGNISEIKQTTMKIDNTKPTGTWSINSQTAGSNSWYKSLSLKATLSDNASGVSSTKYCTTTSSTCTPNTDAALSNNTFTVTFNNHVSTQKVCMEVTDAVGNKTDVICSDAYKVDNTVPTQSFAIGSSTAGTNGWYQALSVKVTASDSHSGVSSAKYCTTTSTTCTPSTNATLSSNAFNVTLGNNASLQRVCAQMTDTAGNVSETTCSDAYKVDTTNPTAKISATTSLGTATISANGSSDTGSGIGTYYYSKDGTNYYSSTANIYTFTGLTSGTYTFYVKVLDNAGRTSSVVTTTATINLPLATNYITSLASSNSSLVYDNTVDNNLRYIGANPNNYVRFNNELWRIIGVMNNIDDGNGNKASRLKIIRNESIGFYSWDSSASSINNGWGVNEWSQADLNTLLNDYYYNAKSNQTCYNERNNATTSCDFSSNGLKDTTSKNMIDTVVWNTGTNGTNSYTSARNGLSSHFYTYERSNDNGKLCTIGTNCTDTVTRTTTWKGKIGLMYPSDYGYATSGGATTNREACLNKELRNWNSSSFSDCKNNDWLYNSSSYQWTLMPRADSSHPSYVFRVHNDGIATGLNGANAYGVAPTLYLTANTRIESGMGTENAPFTLTAG